jgi:hypothetical protein
VHQPKRSAEAGNQGNPPRQSAPTAAFATAEGATPLLGRDRELIELRGALSRAVAGHGKLLLISGEAGIGKTRLVGELAETVLGGDSGAGGDATPRVVWGRCWDSGGAPSMWPWIGVLRELSAGRDTGELRQELGSAAPWLAQLVPELREQLEELEDARTPDSEQSRFVLFDALASFLRRSGVRQPLMVVLEDIHAADQLSMLALLFVARQLSDMRVLVIATHRDPETVQAGRRIELFGKLAGVGQRVSLSGLKERELSQLIEARGGSVTDLDTARALHRTTGGNPFFTDEVLRMLSTEGRLESLRKAEVIPLRVPTGVRGVIEQRLDALPEATQQALRSAAVIGTTFSLGTLAHASGRERGELLAALDEAITVRLIDADPGDVAGFRFVHDLIRETAYAGLAPLQRASAHTAVGKALVRRYAGTVDSHVEEVAHHFLAALPAGEPELALEYAQRAADYAMAKFGHERAARLYRAALDALDLVEDLEPQQRALRRAELLLGLGRARVRIADPGGRETLREAAAAARASGSAESHAHVALAFGAFGLSPGVVDTELTALLEEALAGIGPEDSLLRVHLVSCLARALYWSHNDEPRRSLIDDAVAMARRLDDPEALGIALGYCISAIRGPDTVELEFEWIDELLSLPQPPRELAVLVRSTEIDLLLEQGALSAADAAIDTLDGQAERLRDLRARAYVPVHRARRAFMEGRFADAQRFIAQASEISRDFEDSTFPLTIGGARFALSLLQGHPEEPEGGVRPLAEALPDMHLWRAGLSLICAAKGDRAEAQRLFARLAARGFVDIPRNTMWLITFSLLAETCATLGEPERARELYELLLPFADRTAISPVSGYRGPVARYLGLLAATTGDSAAAEQQLRAALELARRHRTPPMTATIAIDLAENLLVRDDAARTDAAALLDEAAVLGDQLGTPAIGERAQALRARLPAAAASREPAPAPAAGPTQATLVREGEVWAFDFDGRTVRVRDSKGIRHLAELLSLPTVEVHALDLVRTAEPGNGAAEGAAAAAAAADLSVEDPGSGAGSALDAAAKAAYRRRLEDLREELDEAQRFNDPERASRAREEIDFIGRELASAVGLGGRDRPQSSAAERARVNVTRAIKSAIKRLSEQDPELGRELETTIHTGLFCRHEPDLRRPVRWEVHAR